MELIGIVIGATAVLFTSWATLWYKIGRLTTEMKSCNEKLHALEQQVEKLMTTRLYHCDDGGEK